MRTANLVGTVPQSENRTAMSTVNMMTQSKSIPSSTLKLTGWQIILPGHRLTSLLQLGLEQVSGLYLEAT